MMKYLYALPLALFFSLNAHALDNFSLIRGLGTGGQFGHEVLELNCVKKTCAITVLQNEQITAKKTITRKDADAYFKLAKKAMATHKPASVNLEGDQTTPAEASLEWKGSKLQKKGLNSALLSLETKLRARVRS